MKSRAILVLLALLAFAAPARAMNWSLGANLGLVVVDPTEDGVESVTLFGWPSQGLLNIVGVPGLRLGFQGENPQHQFYLDSGFSLVSTDGASLTTFQLTGNYQYDFAGGGSTHPYLTAGLGIVNFSSNDLFGDASAMSPVFGAGVGVAHRLGHGHGTVRAEIRLDHANEGEDAPASAPGVRDGTPLIPASNNIGLKLGFDLWMK